MLIGVDWFWELCTVKVTVEFHQPLSIFKVSSSVGLAVAVHVGLQIQ